MRRLRGAVVVAGVSSTALIAVLVAALAVWHVRTQPARDAFQAAWADAQQVRPGTPLADAVALMRTGRARHVFVYGPSRGPDLTTEVTLDGIGEPSQETVRGVYFKDTFEWGTPHGCTYLPATAE